MQFAAYKLQKNCSISCRKIVPLADSTLGGLEREIVAIAEAFLRTCAEAFHPITWWGDLHGFRGAVGCALPWQLAHVACLAPSEAPTDLRFQSHLMICDVG